MSIDFPSLRALPANDARTTRRSFLAAAAAAIALPPGVNARLPDSNAFDRFIKAQMTEGEIPGLAVGIARSGGVVLAKGYGYADIAGRRPVTVDSMFHLASVTKTVTATGIMMLVERGRITLDEPVDRYLDFPLRHPADPGVRITARHLLMHMSGISDATYYDVDFRTPGKDSPLPLGDFLKDYLVPGGSHYTAGGSFTAQPPGSAYDYSNVGYGLLGYLGGRVAGTDFRNYLRDRLFDPLGMTHCSWTIADVPSRRRVIPYAMSDGRPMPVEPVGFPDWSAGMLRASIGSFMPYVAAAANRGSTERTHMLAAPSMAQMLTMHAPPGLPAWMTGQGLGWMETADGGIPRINHWGGDPGVFTAAYLDPVSATGVAVFANISVTESSKKAIKAISRYLFYEDAG